MLDNLQTLCLGLAAVVDTALLVALLERGNWRRVLRPVAVLWGGVWVFHAAAFFYVLLFDLSSPWTARLHWAAMAGMALGLLVIPCSMVHVLLRLARLARPPPISKAPDLRFALLYLPVLAIVPLSRQLTVDPRGGLFDVLAPFIRPYVVSFSIVSACTAFGFLRMGHREEAGHSRSFFLQVAVALLLGALIVLFTGIHALDRWPEARDELFLFNAMLPIAPSLIFAYSIMRFGFLGIVLRRTVVYGVIVLGVALFHHLVVSDLAARLEEKYRVDFFILEGIAIVLLIVLYEPLRKRTSEALRYLMGTRASEVRGGARKLAYRLSALAGECPGSRLKWFVEEIRKTFRLTYVAGWRIAPSESVHDRAGETERLGDERVLELYRALTRRDARYASRYNTPDERILRTLEDNAASLLVPFGEGEVAGLLLFGRRTRRDLGEEEINSILILVEQLRGTMTNSLLQAERIAMERQALQNEKLSTMGLLASSLAHEVKNPLSSIKTIATVMAEELGPGDRHAEDLRLLIDEVNRLADTTSVSLGFIRPAALGEATCDAASVIDRTLRVLAHVTKEKGVVISTRLEENLPPVSANENALREVLFNLLSNSLEALPRGGKVRITGERQQDRFRMIVEDDGPGIPPGVRGRIFQPFVTTKAEGTGLGLYVVERRVRELGGAIECDSDPGVGTRFTVELPVARRA